MGMISFAIIAGCSTMPPGSYDKSGAVNPMLEPAAIQKFSDVPVPAGFKLLPQQSYSFESGGIRVGILRYQGKAFADQIVNFYKEQMPLHNWNLLNVIEYGDRLMNFEREGETCIVSLLSKGNTSVITLSLGPKTRSPAATRKPKDPVK